MSKDNNVLVLLRSLTNFGWSDLVRATEWLDEAEVDYDDFSEFVFAYCRETETTLQGLDVPALALECIAEQAGVGEMRGWIHSNFLCSCFDIGEEEAGEILYRLEEDQWNAARRFLGDFTAAVAPYVAA